MNRRNFLVCAVQVVVALIVAPAAVVKSQTVTLASSHVPTDVLEFDLLKKQFDFTVEYVQSKSAWFVTCGGYLQDGKDWVAGDFCDEEDIEESKKVCLNAMRRRFKWLNDLNHGPNWEHV